MADIESGEVPQPTNISVGFNETDPDEAEIERQLLEAEKQGTSLGEIEDKKQKQEAEVKPADEKKDDSTEGDEPKPDNSETPAGESDEQPTEQPRIDGKFAPKDPSAFEKAKKEKERLAKGWTEFEAECKARGVDVEALNTGKRSWKDLERCKEFTRKQIESAVASERAALEQQRARLEQASKNRGDFSPQEYTKASQEFTKAAWDALANNDPEAAKKAFQDADACIQAAQRTWEFQLVTARDKDVAETCKKYPELNDPNSEAGQAMMRLLQENPYLAQLPNGFSKAAQFLVNQRDAARVSELEGQLKQAIQERDDARKELKAATSLAGAGSQQQPAARDFDNMSDAEREKSVERMFSPSGEFIPS